MVPLRRLPPQIGGVSVPRSPVPWQLGSAAEPALRGALAVDFVELAFGLSPYGGSGALEVLILLKPGGACDPPTLRPD
jgi:hypothetical protein